MYMIKAPLRFQFRAYAFLTADTPNCLERRLIKSSTTTLYRSFTGFACNIRLTFYNFGLFLTCNLSAFGV